MKEKATLILASVNIVDIVKNYIPLEKLGDNYRSKCPFHQDTDPSLSVSPTLGIFKCFGAGCGASGNVAGFVSRYEGVSYDQALVILANKIGRPDLAPDFKSDDFKDVLTMNEIVLNAYQKCLFTRDENSEKARMGLRDRRITQETAKLFELGYSPNSWTWLVDQSMDNSLLAEAGLILKTDAGHYRDFFKNRIIFPMYHKNKLIGFTGRTLGVSKKIPKYLNSKDSDWFKKNRMMYGWHINGAEVRKTKDIVLVEGQFDVLQLYQRGITNSVAVSGSYFGPQQAKLFSHYINNATIFSDGDEAGINASLRIGEFLVDRNIELNIIYLAGKDPDEASKYKHRFDWNKLNSKYSSSLCKFAFEHRGIEEALKRISGYRNKLKLSRNLAELSELSGYEENYLEHWLIEYKRSPMTVESLVAEKTQLSLQDELLLISAVNGDIPINTYLKRRLSSDYLENIENKPEGLVQELAQKPEFASRLHTLSDIKDKEKYAKDLIVKLNLEFMKKDVRQYKQKLKNTGDTKYLEPLQKMVQRINKLKLKVRTGRSYESSQSKSNSSSV